MSDTMIECDDCTEEIEESDAVPTQNGAICSDCDENYSTCEDCDDRVNDNEIASVNNGSSWVCQSCIDNNYASCEDCGEIVSNDDVRYTLSDESVCDSCVDNAYSYCDECEGYYHHDSYDDHEHGDCGIDCASPAMRFSIRNGDALLDNDVRVTASLPAGFLTDEAIGEIARLIRAAAPPVPYDLYTTDPTAYAAAVAVSHKWMGLSYRLDEIGPEWAGKQGNYPKRLSRFAYKEFGLRVTPEIMTQVGNIGRSQSEGTEVEIEITRDLNLPAEDFAHEDSCWWQSYSSSRCALKTNGGFGIRSFGTVEFPRYEYVTGPWRDHFGTKWTQTGVDVTHERVTGRAWVMPIKQVDGSLRPTFDAENPDGFVVFNGYGDLSGFTSARILADMVGMSYRKVGLHAEPMYINGDGGYLVGPESLLAAHGENSIYLDTPQHANLHANERVYA